MDTSVDRVVADEEAAAVAGINEASLEERPLLLVSLADSFLWKNLFILLLCICVGYYIKSSICSSSTQQHQ